MSPLSEARHNELREQATTLLARCGNGVPPTDRSVILEHLGLKKEEFLLPTDLTHEVGADIRAVLDVKGRCIYVHSGVHNRQKDWATLHEIGHHQIEWHRELLYLDPLYHLMPDVRKVMEQEANAYAAELAFQGTRFHEIAADFPFGLNSAIYLADMFDVSLEASFRRYVEKASTPCVLMISKAADGQQTIRYYVKSPHAPFRITPHQVVPATSVVYQAVNSPGEVIPGEIQFLLDGKAMIRRVECFATPYSVFTLVL